MHKKISWVMLLLFLTSILAPTHALAAGNFPDISNHWAKDYINDLAATGYVNGYPDGTFKPDKIVSQAEFLTVLILSMGANPTDSSTKYFNDTSKHWALKYINEAVKRGILIPSEYSNYLQPDVGLKRSQLAAMVVRALGKEPDYGPLNFSDSALVEQSDYRGYIKVAYDLGLLSGYTDGEFKPFEYVTRAQMCKVMSEFLKIYDGSPVNSGNTVSGPIKYIAIGDELYSLNQVPVYFKVNLNNIRISSISTNDDYIIVNNEYLVHLDSKRDNPDIVVNNKRYGVSKLLINGDKLVAYPSCLKIESLRQGNYTYYADYVKLYINAAYTEKYLSDMEIVDKYTVIIDNKTYDLETDQITIELGQNFYNIAAINLGEKEIDLKLELTDPVIIEGIDIDDIAAIFVEDDSLNLKKIDRIEFLIDGERYRQKDIIVDASGNFTVNNETFSPEGIVMIIDNSYYTIDHFRIYRNKYIFYCTENEQEYWVRLNNLYVDPEEVKILKDNVAYDMDEVLVVERNVVRINNKQYKVNSSFKCLYDGDVYDIDRIDYDTTRDCVEIRGEITDDSFWANQPSKYVFYNDDTKYQDGVTKNTRIYVERRWVDFDEIMIVDPAHLSYDGKSYDLIGARIRIDRVEFEVVDTSWRGQNRVMTIYMEEV
mgnify:CR=1 FL=1